MSTPAAERRSGGLIDRRLTARAAVTRRYLIVAVAVGVASTVCVVVQAVLLASVIARVVEHRVALRAVEPQVLGLAAAFVLRAALAWLGEAAAQRTSATVTSTLRRQLLRHALDLGPGWLAGERAGELSLTATRGIAALDSYFGRYLPVAVVAVVAPVGILAWVAYTDWVSALILVALVALVPVAMILFGREATKRTRRQWRRLSSLSARFLELIQGLATLRAFGRAAQGRREVAAATEGLRQTTMGTLRVAFMSALAMEFLAGMGVGLVAMVLGLRLLSGTVALGTALAVLLVSPEVFIPLRRAGAEFHTSTEGQAAAERILDVLDLGVEVPDTTTAPALPDPATAVLCLHALSVAYPGRGVPAVDALELRVPPGAHVALVGPSGSGKSTVLAALLGFVPLTRGSIDLGGVDLALVPPAMWRRRIAWVPQHPHLFSGTIAENLRFGDPSASEADLRRAVATAGLDEMLDQLPAGLETPVGDGGLPLSAGERQRLAIARAVLRDAPLVLLDEPAAHLDARTEAELRRSLAPWLEGRTVIVAAHRTELVDRIDRVVRLGSAEPGEDCDADRPVGVET
ncbi:MAG: thiol reductant ABC exporter subunit CydD [Acidimicrobiales bacterium]